jgi:hypothetical protein
VAVAAICVEDRLDGGGSACACLTKTELARDKCPLRTVKLCDGS